MSHVRLDAWLFAVRIYKTRALAKQMCLRGRVEIGGQRSKPSQKVITGALIQVKKDSIWRVFQAIKLVNKRISPKVWHEYVEEKTDKKIIDQW